jgi:hypothetical protein
MVQDQQIEMNDTEAMNEGRERKRKKKKERIARKSKKYF